MITRVAAFLLDHKINYAFNLLMFFSLLSRTSGKINTFLVFSSFDSSIGLGKNPKNNSIASPIHILHHISLKLIFHTACFTAFGRQRLRLLLENFPLLILISST